MQLRDSPECTSISRFRARADGWRSCMVQSPQPPPTLGGTPRGSCRPSTTRPAGRETRFVCTRKRGTAESAGSRVQRQCTCVHSLVLVRCLLSFFPSCLSPLRWSCAKQKKGDRNEISKNMQVKGDYAAFSGCLRPRLTRPGEVCRYVHRLRLPAPLLGCKVPKDLLPNGSCRS